MAQCTYKNDDGSTCGYNVKDGYTLCWNHYQATKAQTTKAVNDAPRTAPSTEKGKWHDDPQIDLLLKINHNLSRIVRLLEQREPSPPKESLFSDKPYDPSIYEER